MVVLQRDFMMIKGDVSYDFKFFWIVFYKFNGFNNVVS